MTDNKKVLKTEEEFLTELGFDSVEEYELSLKYEQYEHEKHANEEAIKMGFKNADEMYKEFESYGKYTDDNGVEQYDEKLAEFDKKASEIKKIETKIIEKPKLYNKDDLAKGSDLAAFDSMFRDIYSKSSRYNYKIYDYLKHHYSYGRAKLIKDAFSGEEDAIRNFMDIEEIVYVRADGSNKIAQDGYYFPYLNAIRSYGDAYKIVKNELLKLSKLLHELNIKGIHHQQGYLEVEFNKINEIKIREPIVQFYENIKFSGKTDFLKSVAEIIVNNENPALNNPEYKKAVELVLYHWMWRVKYKLQRFLGVESPLKTDLFQYNPLVPVLYGTQGAGKTTLVDKFINPFRVVGIVGEPTTKSLFESYSFDHLSKNLILFMDDFEKVSDDLIPEFKKMISGVTRSGRQKGDPSSKNFAIFASFIMATNKDLSEMVADDTGNRRFFQIEVKKSFEALKDRDFIAAWRSVDENSLPISQDDIEKYIKPFQELTKKKTRQALFIEEFGIKAKMYNNINIEERTHFVAVPARHLVKIYGNETNYKLTTSSPSYIKLLQELKVTSVRAIVDNVRESVIYLDKREFTNGFETILKNQLSNRGYK